MSEGVKPIVAIVGRPNVGKSRLFNRLLKATRSIVVDQPGVTRDRIYADAELIGPNGAIEIVLVDTGGFDPKTNDPIMRRVLEQTQLAIDEADVVVFLTDAHAGLMAEDHDIASLLRKSNKRVVAAVNKIDGPNDDPLAADFYRLGLGEPIPISAVHGRHVMDLEELIVEALPSREGDRHAIEEPPDAGEDPSGGAARDPRGGDRAAELGQVVADQSVARRGSAPGVGGAGHHGRRDRLAGGARRAAVSLHRHRRHSQEAIDRDARGALQRDRRAQRPRAIGRRAAC